MKFGNNTEALSLPKGVSKVSTCLDAYFDKLSTCLDAYFDKLSTAVRNKHKMVYGFSLTEGTS
jgi:hypothetical protein